MAEEGSKSERTSPTVREQIAIRNNWLKIMVVSVATGLMAVKIWQADLSGAMAGFDFTDLLTLFLAMFSIALAVLFYLKATESSSVFYDNTYRFTRDVSEILGRVEAGFGERLRHLDEGYTGLKSVVERIPFDRIETEKEIQEEEQTVRKVEQERVELIENLAQRARLQEEEKRNLFKRLQEQDRELANARQELAILKNRIAEAEAEGTRPLPMLPASLKNFLAGVVVPDINLDSPYPIAARTFARITASMPAHMVGRLHRYGVTDRNGRLTEEGWEFIRGAFGPK